MGRGPRIDRPGGWHHVMNRGVDRQETFRADADRVEFGRLLGVGHDRFGVEVHAYCLMPNHFHLLVHCPDGGLSEYMQLLTAVHTRHVNERVGRDGPLYRGRFRSLPVDTDRYLLASVRYIHRNPLGLPGVDGVEGYRWSSHRSYLGRRAVPPWLRVDVVLGILGGDAATFHRFVADDDAAPPPGSAAPRNDLDAVVRLVLEEWSPDVGRAHQGLARTIKLLVLDELDDDAVAVIAAELGGDDPRRLAQARWRANRRASAHPALREAARRVAQLADLSRVVSDTTRDTTRDGQRARR